MNVPGICRITHATAGEKAQAFEWLRLQATDTNNPRWLDAAIMLSEIAKFAPSEKVAPVESTELEEFKALQPEEVPIIVKEVTVPCLHCGMVTTVKVTHDSNSTHDIREP